MMSSTALMFRTSLADALPTLALKEHDRSVWPGALNATLVIHGNVLKGEVDTARPWDVVADILLANPPFSGMLEAAALSPSLRAWKTKKTELLFLALTLQHLRPNGRCAIVLPEGVLFGSTLAHRALRRVLVCERSLQAVIAIPSGTFLHAGVSTAILIFRNSGHTDEVWFYDVESPGFTLDKRRTETSGHNDLWDLIIKFLLRTGQPACPWLDEELWSQWQAFDATERTRHYAQPVASPLGSGTHGHARIPHVDIIELEEPRDWTCAVADLNDHYALNGRQYRPRVETVVEHESPADLLQSILESEDEIRSITLGLLHLVQDLEYRATGEPDSASREEHTTTRSNDEGVRRQLRQLCTTFRVLLTQVPPPASPQDVDQQLAAFHARGCDQVLALLDTHDNDADMAHRDLGATLGAFHDVLQAITAVHAEDLRAHRSTRCTICGAIGSATVQLAGIQRELLANTPPQNLVVRMKTAGEDQQTPVGTVVEAIAWVTKHACAVVRLADGDEHELSLIIRNPPQYAEDQIVDSLDSPTCACAHSAS